MFNCPTVLTMKNASMCWKAKQLCILEKFIKKIQKNIFHIFVFVKFFSQVR